MISSCPVHFCLLQYYCIIFYIFACRWTQVLSTSRFANHIQTSCLSNLNAILTAFNLFFRSTIIYYCKLNYLQNFWDYNVSYKRFLLTIFFSNEVPNIPLNDIFILLSSLRIIYPFDRFPIKIARGKNESRRKNLTQSTVGKSLIITLFMGETFALFAVVWCIWLDSRHH